MILAFLALGVAQVPPPLERLPAEPVGRCVRPWTANPASGRLLTALPPPGDAVAACAAELGLTALPEGKVLVALEASFRGACAVPPPGWWLDPGGRVLVAFEHGHCKRPAEGRLELALLPNRPYTGITVLAPRGEGVPPPPPPLPAPAGAAGAQDVRQVAVEWLGNCEIFPFDGHLSEVEIVDAMPEPGHATTRCAAELGLPGLREGTSLLVVRNSFGSQCGWFSSDAALEPSGRIVIAFYGRSVLCENTAKSRTWLALIPRGPYTGVLALPAEP